MSPPGSAATPYLTGAAAGLLAKAMSLVAGFGNLWLLTRILEKEQFASYVFVLALLTWLAVVGTVGLDRTVLFRLSRIDAPPGALVGGPLVAAALVAVLPISAAFALLVAAGTAIGDVGHLPGLAFWLAVLAMMVVTTCLGRVFEAWYWARGRVAPSVLIPAAGEIARTVALAVAFVAAPTRTGVAFAVVVAAFVPLLLWLVVAPLRELRQPARLLREDLSYGLKTMAGRAADEGTHHVDVLMIGLLATAAATADYAVAARFAILVALVKGLLGPVLTPRLGRYSAFGSRDVLLREYNQVRLVGLVAALFSAAVLAALGRPVLALFGDYAQSYPLIMVLVAGYVVSVGFGSNAALLSISGHAGWTLAARVALLAAIVVLNLVLIPFMGAMGAALGMAIGQVAVNALLCAMIWRLDGLPTISPGIVLVLGAALALLLLLGFDAIGSIAGALGLVVLAVWLLARYSSLWLPLAKELLGRRRSG